MIKKSNQHQQSLLGSIVVIALAFVIGGCATFEPVVVDRQTESTRPARADAVKPVKITIKRASGVCGDLGKFTLDIALLDGKTQKSLLDSMLAQQEAYFSCDHLKTGLLLSQIGQTAAEDQQAINILKQYRQGDDSKSSGLTEFELFLIELTWQQARQHKRLHVLLENLGEQLVAEKALTEIMSDDLLTLQQQINQLKQIENDINETEQSLSTPATTGITPGATENTGS